MDYFGDINIHGYNSKIHLNSNPDIANPFNGFICNDYVTPNVNYGDIVYFNLSKKLWDQSCANDVNTLPARGIACSSFTSVTKKIPILMFGFFYWDNNPNVITSSQLWLSDSVLGEFSSKQPSTIGNYVQTLGTAKTQEIYFFDFCPFYIKLG